MLSFFLARRRPPSSTLFPYTTLFRSSGSWSRSVTRSTSAAASPAPSRSCCPRSEEHTSELQSPCNLVCRLLLEKKNHSSPSTIGKVLSHLLHLRTGLSLIFTCVPRVE